MNPPIQGDVSTADEAHAFIRSAIAAHYHVVYLTRSACEALRASTTVTTQDEPASRYAPGEIEVRVDDRMPEGKALALCVWPPFPLSVHPPLRA